MTLWANAAKTIATEITTSDNLQSLATSKFVESSARIDFDEMILIQGESQDTIVFNLTNQKDCKMKDGIVAFCPSQLHLMVKDRAGKYPKPATWKDKFYIDLLRSVCETGKTYAGHIDFGVPETMLPMFEAQKDKPDLYKQLTGAFVNLIEVPINVFSKFVPSEGNSFSGGGYSKGQTEADRLTDRLNYVKAYCEVAKLTMSDFNKLAMVMGVAGDGSF